MPDLRCQSEMSILRYQSEIWDLTCQSWDVNLRYQIWDLKIMHTSVLQTSATPWGRVGPQFLEEIFLLLATECICEHSFFLFLYVSDLCCSVPLSPTEPVLRCQSWDVILRSQMWDVNLEMSIWDIRYEMSILRSQNYAHECVTNECYFLWQGDPHNIWKTFSYFLGQGAFVITHFLVFVLVRFTL